MAEAPPAIPHALHPTSGSWLNLIERWSRDLTDKQIRRGAFKSVDQLIQAIAASIDALNGDAKPLVWTAKVDDIGARVRRARATLEKTRHQ